MFTKRKEYWYMRTSDFGTMQKDYKTNLKSTQHSLKTEMDLNSLQLLYETQKNYLKKTLKHDLYLLRGSSLKDWKN